MKHIDDIAIDKSKSYKLKYWLSKIRFWWKYKLFPKYYKKKLANKILKEQLFYKNYNPEQCPRRIWNNEEQKWNKFFNNCNVCSFMCSERAKDFEKLGKKLYYDKKTGLSFYL